jgi:hypothetical protein
VAFGVGSGVGRAVAIETGGVAVGCVTAPPGVGVGASATIGPSVGDGDGDGSTDGPTDGTGSDGLASDGIGEGAGVFVGSLVADGPGVPVGVPGDGAGVAGTPATCEAGGVGATNPAVSATVARMRFRRPMATTRRAR